MLLTSRGPRVDWLGYSWCLTINTSVTYKPWLWLLVPVHCGSWRVSAAGGPVGGALEAAETLEMVGAPPSYTKTNAFTFIRLKFDCFNQMTDLLD